MKILPLLVVGVLATISSISVSAQNVVINGDFETPPYDTVGTVSGWVVGGNGNVSEAEEGSTSGTHSAAFSVGTNSEGDTLSQSFATTAGVEYTLAFDAAVFGMPSATLQLQIEVFGTGTLLDETITPPVSNSFDPAVTSGIYQNFSFSFTADSGTTTLQFSNIGQGNSFADVVIDTVVVTVPEPSTTAILIFGAGSLLGFLRLKRNSRA